MINSKCLFVVLCYGIISCFYSCIQKPIKEVWLDDFGSDSCYIQDWGRVLVNTSVLNTPLTVNGVVYDRG